MVLLPDREEPGGSESRVQEELLRRGPGPDEQSKIRARNNLNDVRTENHFTDFDNNWS